MKENQYIERNLNFDQIVDRKNTNSLKYDFAKQRGMPEDVLPLWVADMDFKTSSIVLDLLTERVAHGIFGYTETEKTYYDAVIRWMKEKHDYEVDERWLIKTPGVVVALACAVKAYTDQGDTVLIQQPVYYPFTEVILDNHRKVISNDLVLENGKYQIDYVDFERKIVDHNIKLFILCSPHNPVGRVWKKEELERIGDICVRHGVVVVCDEIHHDFVYQGNKHIVFASIKPSFADLCVTCTSPAKTFNLAGLQISNIIISNLKLYRKFKKEIDGIGYSQANTMGIEACKAAYTYGDLWYKSMLSYLSENIQFVKTYLSKYIPQIQFIEPEGTYLIWLNLRGLGLNPKEQQDLIVNKAKLWLDSGTIFGDAGTGFERLNIACPRKILEQALWQLRVAIENTDN